MGRLKLLEFYVGVVIAGLHLAESEVMVRFTEAPPAWTRHTTAVFRYSVVDAGGLSPCEDPGCSMYCELDGMPLSSCSFTTTILRNLTANYNHHFLLSITTSAGERNSSSYDWYIDTTPPTASIFREQTSSDAASIAIGIVFSEPCTGQGGFKCSNASSCDVIVHGPATVDATTLQIIEPDIEYSLVVVLSPGKSHGRVVIKMANSFCTDQAGNHFTRTSHSILLVHIDRRPVHAQLWTLIPSYKLEIQRIPRLVLATNKISELTFFLRFRKPILNSTEDILRILTTNSGYFVPILSRIHGDRHFAFELRNVSTTSIVMVKLQSEYLLGRSGNPVSPVIPIIFLYDTTKPGVVVSTNSLGFMKEASFNVMVEFTKPVFGFDASKIKVRGGKVARFKEISKALYSLIVLVISQNAVSLHVPEGQVNDVTGNVNSASNQLEVRHCMNLSFLASILNQKPSLTWRASSSILVHGFSWLHGLSGEEIELQETVNCLINTQHITPQEFQPAMPQIDEVVLLDSAPALTVALHSSITAGLLVTLLADAVLSFSAANLAVTGGTNNAVANMVTSDPSRNLLGMTGHLQVFALSDWFLLGLPLEYSETTKGLRWLIPHVNVPWNKKEELSIWLHNLSTYDGQSSLLTIYKVPDLREKRMHDHSTGLNPKCTILALEEQNAVIFDVENSTVFMHCISTGQGGFGPTMIDSKDAIFDRSENGTAIGRHYGLPLNSEEYFSYFLRGEPLSAAIVAKRMENYNGWQDFQMNMFWLGVGGGTLLLIHLLALLFLRWRMGTSVHGLLSAPGFELFLVILMLPCIGQSAAFTIRGGTTGGIVVGAMLLAILSALLLSLLLFLAIAIFLGNFFEYKEVEQRDVNGSLARRLSVMLTGKPIAGGWFQCEGTPSFLGRCGILFENRKGPPTFIPMDTNDPTNTPLWISSGQTGTGRMKAVSSEDSNKYGAAPPPRRRLVGCLRSAYIMLDLVRRAGLGVISGAYSSPRQSQCIIACGATLLQFLYLLLLKPYIRRGVNVVESISLLCETGIFLLMLYIDHLGKTEEQKSMGIAMVALMFVSFVSQLTNEWYALINCIIRLPQARKPSFKLGLKWAGKGLILPLLPKKHWSRLVPGSWQPMTGLVPVVPLSPEDDRYAAAAPCAEPSTTQTTATVVPVHSPDQPASGRQPLPVPRVDKGSSLQLQGRQVAKQVSRPRKEEEKQPKVLNLEPGNDMRKLRELARASFSSRYQKSGEEGSSHVARVKRCLEEPPSHGSSAASSSRSKR